MFVCRGTEVTPSAGEISANMLSRSAVESIAELPGAPAHSFSANLHSGTEYLSSTYGLGRM